MIGDRKSLSTKTAQYSMMILGVVTILGAFEFMTNTFSGNIRDTSKIPVLFVGNDGVCDNVRMFGDPVVDGAGWWLCWPKNLKANKENCKVLSWGIQDHFSFDEAAVKEGCDVHGFDPSPLGLGSNKKYEAMGGNYHTYGLGKVDNTYSPGTVPFNWPGIKYLRASNSDTWVLKNIPTTIDITGVAKSTTPEDKSNSNKLTVLKIDVEGTEWFIMEQLYQNHDWDQLLLELHFTPTDYHLSDVGNNKGFIITRLPAKGFISTLFPSKIDYIKLWKELMSVSTMWKYEFNMNDRARACLEVYLTRKRH